MLATYLESQLEVICAQPRSFEYISSKLNGLDPIQIHQGLKDLQRQKKLKKLSDYWLWDNSHESSEEDEVLIEKSESFIRKYMGYYDFLKTPHPLDFEWRNTLKSLNQLAANVNTINTLNKPVLILGMPTLFATIAERNLPFSTTLIERNSPIVKGLKKFESEKNQVVKSDIFKVNGSDLKVRYQYVVMDPPWYSEYFQQFAWLASDCLEIGGKLIVSIPPINTRPDIDQERVDWLSFCQKLGFCIESLEPDFLQYAMPFFEFNAFRAAGVGNLLPFWRKGDVLVLRKVKESQLERPQIVEKISGWKEVEYEKVRIRVNLDVPDAEGELVLDDAVKNAILPTVSSRDKRRDKANVWTSGNRIFYTNKPQLVYNILKGKSPTSNRECNFIKKHFDHVAQLEGKEYYEYLQLIYYEMERESH